jgi:hypothetical protein
VNEVLIDITEILTQATEEIYKALNYLEKMKAKTKITGDLRDEETGKKITMDMILENENIQRMTSHMMFPVMVKKSIQEMCGAVDELLKESGHIEVRIVKISAPNVPAFIVETAYLIIFESVMRKLDKYECGKKITVSYVKNRTASA